MGGAPSALFEQPWRDVKCKDNLEFVKSYQPQNKQVEHLNVLLYGPVGAGKSSFINSVDQVLKGRPAGRAQTDAISGSSYTKKYETFKFYKSSGAKYSFVFNDIMGFEEGPDSGVLVDDVKQALRGHVKEGYKFNSAQKLTEEDSGYNSAPTLEDKVHVLVCVFPAVSVSRLNDKMVKQIREVRMEASDLGIPQLAIITKVDEACPEVKKDTNNIYQSIYLKEQVERFHLQLGLQMNCIFLVKNYSHENESNCIMDHVILCALKQTLCFGDDFLEKMKTPESGNLRMEKGYQPQVSAPPYSGPPMNYGGMVHPQEMLCPHCSKYMFPTINHIEGQLKWDVCGGLPFSGNFLCRCFPFCFDTCKDVEHRCPICRKVIYL